MARDGEGSKHFFERIASQLYRNPFWAIWLSILATAALGVAGGRSPRWVEGADRLYSLQRSLARTHGALYRLLFPESRVRNSFVLFTAADGNAAGSNAAGGSAASGGASAGEEGDDLVRPLEGGAAAAAGAAAGALPGLAAEERRRGAEGALAPAAAAIVAAVDRIVRGLEPAPLSGRRVLVGTLARPEVGAVESPGTLAGRAAIGAYESLCPRDARGFCENSVAARLVERGANGQRLLSIDGFLVDLETLRFIPLGTVLGGAETEECWVAVPPVFINMVAQRRFPAEMLDESKFVFNRSTSEMRFECVVKADAVLLTYSMPDEPEIASTLSALWESEFLAALRPLRNFYEPVLHVDVAAFRSRDDELKASTFDSGDASYVALTFLALLGYATISNFSFNLYKAHYFSGLAGAAAALMGLLAGLGLCCACGLALVPTAFVCPFLVLGIGVDDMFVILNSYELAYHLKGEARCRAALKNSGFAISLTTITSLTSFFVGTWNPYLAIRNFCVFCAAGLFFGYIFVFTVFFPVLCLDCRREAERTVCCFGTEIAARAAAADSAVDSPRGGGGDFQSESTQRGTDCQAWRDGALVPMSVLRKEPPDNVGRWARRFALRYYGPFLMHPWTKGGVLLFFAAVIVVACLGLSRLERGLDMPDLAPRNSYLRKFDHNMARHFDAYDFPADVFFADGGAPWWDAEYLARVLGLTAALRRGGVAVRVINPLQLLLLDEAFAPALRSGQRGPFEAALRAALARPAYGSYAKSFIFQGEHLRAWKLTVLPPAMRTSQERAAWMLELRKLCAKFAEEDKFALETAGTTPTPPAGKSLALPFSPPVPFNYLMTYHESDIRLTLFIATEMATAGGVLALVAFLCLPDRRTGLIVTAVMAAIDLSILGAMYFVGVKLNMISMVNLLISIGFAVDYSTHVAHTFLDCRGRSRDERAVEALVVMGTPVLHGAVASVLGISMLGFSQSHIFVIFFRMMGLIVLFGVTYGIVLLPVLLSLVGTFVDHGEEREKTEENRPSTHGTRAQLQ